MERPKSGIGLLPDLSHRRELAKTLTGIRGLDEITRGGLPKGRPTLVCGGPGSGKTLLALTFLVNGTIHFNEPGVLMTFEENAEEIAVASSAGEGQGTTFTLQLKRVPSARTSSGTSFPTGRYAKPRRVLLVEDSGDAREMLRMMLQLAGHVVYDASDGVRGLELLNVVRPDVGIIDISRMIEHYRLEKKRRLVRRAISMWRKLEAQQALLQFEKPLERIH